MTIDSDVNFNCVTLLEAMRMVRGNVVIYSQTSPAAGSQHDLSTKKKKYQEGSLVVHHANDAT